MSKNSKNICFGDPSECKGIITKEHVVSKSILEYFGPLEFKVDKKTIKLGKGTYVIKNLCEHHNRTLSTYDSEALKLFSGWHSFLTNKKTTHPETKTNSINIDIRKIENWYAKTFANSILFRHRALNPKNPLLSFPISSIRKKIFGSERFTPPFGIYMIKPESPLAPKRSAWTLCPQFQNIYHQSAATKIIREVEIPTIYYTCLHGIELIGFFNLTGLNDEQALDSVLKGWAKKLNEVGIYRENINFSTSHESDEHFDGKSPTRFIEFGSTSFKELIDKKREEGRPLDILKGKSIALQK